AKAQPGGAMSRASIGDYVVTSKLGSGSFAVVYKGYHKVTKVPVAIKALSLGKLNSKLLANLEMEIAIMRQIDHPNVVKLYEIKKTEKHMYLMLEYCAGGDLQQYMRRRQQGAGDQGRMLGEDVARHFLRELAQGMQCLWRHNLIHRDLKPQNLLLVEDSPTSALKIGKLSFHLADFGFARHLATASLAETLCGSPLYMAPEILKFQKYDAKADLWSVGTILFEMVAGRPPYGGANHVQLLANIERQPLRFPPTLALSRACRQLLVALLQRKPALRLGFAEFFADPFVDLQPMEEAEEVEDSGHSTTLPATTSIQEEDEDEVQQVDGAESGAGGGQAASDSRNRGLDRRARAFSVSHDASTSSSRFASTAPSAVMRQSRSGNLEVMQTAFASTSSGSGALRRSSRLARSRRATSSGSGFAAAATGTSPRLSPQMSPHVLPSPSPSPSPRINPFKQLSESPPGAAAALQQQQHTSFLASSRTKSPSTPVFTGTTRAKTTGGAHALDSSGEYVLVDGIPEKAAATGTAPTVTASRGAVNADTGGSGSGSSTSLMSQGDKKTKGLATIPLKCGQQLVDIVLLRIQAIAPIADQLWVLSNAGAASAASTAESTTAPVGEEWADDAPNAGERTSLSVSGGGGANFSSVFSISSSLASSGGAGHAFGDEEDEEEDEEGDGGRSSRRQYVCAGEALALYVKCLRVVQQGVLYLRQDPAFARSRGSSGSSSGSSSPPDATPSSTWSESSRKLSMSFLTEQLTHFLTRAEQCKTRMARVARLRTPARPIATQEELLYAHALRLGRQGAIREVLGQTRAAHDHYLQALLLLESLLMETPGPTATDAAALAVEDQKSVNVFLRALEQRLKNVRALLEDAEGQDASASRQRRLQHPPRPHQELVFRHSAATATAAVL
ncbi:hypothetical protein BBJ28_00014886, partial [Nothophytophthora sp. Chile5]